MQAPIYISHQAKMAEQNLGARSSCEVRAAAHQK